MCYKLVEGNNGKIICRSIIYSVTKSETANLQVDPIKNLSDNSILDTEEKNMLDNFMTLDDFETPISHRNKKESVNSILN